MTDNPEPTPFDGAAAPIRIFLGSEVVRVDPDATLWSLAEQLVAAEVGTLVVGRGDTVDGIVSERDVVRAVARDGAGSTATAGELASRKLVWCSPDATVGEAAATMMEHYVRHVLVGHPGVLHGIVSSRDLLGALLG